jgi:hypothetical protein
MLDRSGTLNPHPEEHRGAMRLEGWATQALAAILRDARNSALLGMMSETPQTTKMEIRERQ